MRSDNLAPVRLEVVENHGVQTDADGWEHCAYTVRLTRGDESMLTPWKMGMGLGPEIDAADVLESLILDASGYLRARSFDEWAEEYGLDTDSRKAYATWEEIGELTEQLRDVLGDEDFEAAVFGNEDAFDAAARLTSEDA